MQRLGQIAQRIVQEAAQKAGKSLPQCVCVAAGGEEGSDDLQASPPQVRRSGKGAGRAQTGGCIPKALIPAFDCGEEGRSRIKTGAVEAVTPAVGAASTASG